MNQTALVCGVESVKDDEYFKESVERDHRDKRVGEDGTTKMGFEFPDFPCKFYFCNPSEKKMRSNYLKS